MARDADQGFLDLDVIGDDVQVEVQSDIISSTNQDVTAEDDFVVIELDDSNKPKQDTVPSASYGKQALHFAGGLAVTAAIAWFSGPLVAAATRAAFPYAYSAMIGPVPSTWSLSYYLAYRPALEHTVAAAYNNAPAITAASIASAQVIAHVAIPCVKAGLNGAQNVASIACTGVASGVKNFFGFMRGAKSVDVIAPVAEFPTPRFAAAK